MDPLATLLMLADCTSASDARIYCATMVAWVNAGGFKVPASDLRAKGVSNQRIAGWIRNGWVV